MRVALVLGIVLLASIAQAQERVPVALGSIAGGSGVRGAVTDALEGDARVGLVDDESAARIVIDGTLSGRGRRRTLVITAREPGGHALWTERARGALPRTIASAMQRILDAAIPQVAGAGETRTAPVGSPDPRPESPPPSHGSPPRPSSPLSPSSSSSTDASFGEPVPLLSITAGAGLRSRDTIVHVMGGTSRTYHASPYAELHARIDARPLGSDPTYARGLFFWGEVGYAVGLASALPDRTQVSTTYLRMGAHAGYLLPLLSWMEAGASFGVGWERYDLGTNVVLPAIDYVYLRPAARLRFRIVGELFVLALEGGYRALISRGGLSDAFGSGGDSVGYDVGAIASGTFDFGLCWAIEAGWSEYLHAFSGAPGTLAQGTNGSDAGYRFLFTLGYALR